ncbi:MAG: FAD-binding oxidoreductase [Acidibacillus sp.]|nr:FAD-binding oxidoreductase [Acidibacillus sp.]
MTPLESARIIRDHIADKLHVEAQIDEELGYALTGQCSPVVLVVPTHEEQITNILCTAYEHKWKVMPIGALTQVEMGFASEAVDIALSLKRLDRVIEYSPTDMTIAVGAGITLTALQEVTRVHGQRLPFDPVCHKEATIGGLIATNVSGPSRALYGSLRDITIGLTVVYPDGQMIRTGGKVVKNVAGYDMTKLFIGSLGTLCVITEVIFKLKPIPQQSDVNLIEGKYNDLAVLITKLRTSDMVTSQFELMSVHELSERDEFLLAVGCDEHVAAAEVQAKRIQSICGAMSLRVTHLTGKAADDYWDSYRTHLAGQRSVIRFTCAPTFIVEIAKEMQVNIDQNVFIGISVTVPIGTGRLYVHPLNESSTLHVLRMCRELLYTYDGSAVIEKAPQTRMTLVDVEPLGVLQDAVKTLTVGIKQTIDQRGILSPGRFVGGI